MRRRLPFLAGLLAFPALSAAAVWGGLYLAAPVTLVRYGKEPIHALRVNWNLVLCNSTELDGSGGLRPYVVNATRVRGLKRNLQSRRPGWEFQYAVTDPGDGDHATWMVTIPKFTPVVCIGVAVCAWKWRRRRQLRASRLDEQRSRQPPPDP